MEAMSTGGDFYMIEHFGVGFHVAHLVSDKVRVSSKNNDGEPFFWESMAGGSVTMQKDNEMLHGEVKRGTKIMGYSKEDQFGILGGASIEESSKEAL